MTSRYFDGEVLEFKLEFTNPLQVSIGYTNDVLVVGIVDASMFSSKETGLEIDPNYFMQLVLPKMLPG